jgi:hypothetical protein
MKYQHLLYSLLLAFAFTTSNGQGRKYIYHFDKSLDAVNDTASVFYGTGEPDDTLFC